MDLHDIPEIVGPVHIGLPAPRTPGVYFLMDGEEIVYVGQSCDVRSRIAQHINEGLKQFGSFWYLVLPAKDLNRIERRCIEAYRPKYNNCCFSKFLDYAKAEPVPLKIVSKRLPRCRTRRLGIA